MNKEKSSITFNQNHNQGFFKELKYNLGYQATMPLRLTKNEWIGVGGAAIFTTVLMKMDYKIDRSVPSIKQDNRTFSNITGQVTELGGKYGYGLSALFIGYSYLSKNPKSIETSQLLMQTMISTSVWVRVIKLATGRQRPSNYIGNGHSSSWSGPFKQWTEAGEGQAPSDFDAFPSGHTATAFAIATIFAKQYSDHPIVPILSYSLASIVGISRVVEHTHWASEVVVGGLLGYFCSKQIWDHHQLNHKVSSFSERRFKVIPSYYLGYSSNTLTMGGSFIF